LVNWAIVIRAPQVADDRAGKRRWRNEADYARADAEKAHADARRERELRNALESELQALKARVGKP